MRLEFIAKGSEEASGGSKEEKAGLKILSGDQLKELQQIITQFHMVINGNGFMKCNDYRRNPSTHKLCGSAIYIIMV